MKTHLLAAARLLFILVATTALAQPAGAGTFGGDAACLGIIAPAGTADSGFAVTPRAVVTNLGADPVSFYTRMTIGESFVDSVLVSNLGSQQTDTVRFQPWIPSRNRTWPVRCSTMLAGDPNPSNDARDTVVQVRAWDVGPSVILVPADTVDSGMVLQPWVQIRNHGTEPATFFTHISIGSWHDSVEVVDLQVGENRDVVFNSWAAVYPGPTVARCSTAWAMDPYPSNDTLSRRFVVRGTSGNTDVVAERVISPSSTVLESAMVVPAGVLFNRGSYTAEVQTSFRIEVFGSEVYRDSGSVFLAPGQRDTARFSPWRAAPAGFYNAVLALSAANDTNPENDVIYSLFEVSTDLHDVGASALVRPVGTMRAGTVRPAARVRNYGTLPETFHTLLRVRRGTAVAYADSMRTVTLPPGDSVVLEFRAWDAPAGSYTVTCSTMLWSDQVPANDGLSASLVVETIPMALGWREMRPIPVGAKEVKGGGSLAFLRSDGHVYALKGNKTSEFYRYVPAKDSWFALPALLPGSENKPADKGASLCSDGDRYIYATKGNNTVDFLRYDVATDSWRVLAPIPLGPSNKKVKGGTRLEYVTRGESSYCYLLKGYKNEFYRFDIQGQRWESLPPAPLGTSGKNAYKEGSFIVHDGRNSIIAVKASYNEVFGFDLALNNWLARQYQDLPLYGRANKKKKVKDGGSGAWCENSMVCLKGGNTQETWRFFPGRDSWFELDTIPQLGITGGKKKVKTGGAIVHVGEGVFYALKGNKTREFWRYRIPGIIGVAEDPTPGSQRTGAGMVSVYPNPARRFAYLRVVSPDRCELVRLYDSRGGLVRELPARVGTVRLDCSGLGSGVYFVCRSGAPRRQAARFVVQH